MLRVATFALTAVAMMLSNSVAAQAPATPQATEAPDIEVKARKVCKSEPVVGTRFAKKVCHTPAEWAEIQRNDRATTEAYQRDPCRAGASSAGGNIQC